MDRYLHAPRVILLRACSQMTFDVQYYLHNDTYINILKPFLIARKLRFTTKNSNIFNSGKPFCND